MTNNNLCQNMWSIAHILLHQNRIYTLTNSNPNPEQFLRAIWESVSQAIVLILLKIKFNSQLSCCAFFSVSSVKKIQIKYITNAITTNRWKLLCLLFLLKHFWNPSLPSTLMNMVKTAAHPCWTKFQVCHHTQLSLLFLYVWLIASSLSFNRWIGTLINGWASRSSCHLFLSGHLFECL